VQLKRDFTTLKAPAAGLISARMVEPGQVIAAGAPLLQLIRDNQLEWRAEVAEADFASVQTNTQARLKLPAGGTVDALVRRLSPSLNPSTRTALAYVELPAHPELKAGMYAQGELLLPEVAVLTIPQLAVLRRDGLAFVLLPEQGVARERRVTLGRMVGDAVVVQTGLQEGEQVLTAGVAFLSDGDKIRVVPTAAAAVTPAASAGAKP
jgi:RND family efflux transporter MFP subunit